MNRTITCQGIGFKVGLPTLTIRERLADISYSRSLGHDAMDPVMSAEDLGGCYTRPRPTEHHLTVQSESNSPELHRRGVGIKECLNFPGV